MIAVMDTFAFAGRLGAKVLLIEGAGCLGGMGTSGLVTAFDPDEGVAGEDAGMTATAVLSVSLEPPLILVSVRTGSRMDDVLERQPRWAVSMLAEDQRQIAGRFAMRGRVSDRLLFDEVPAVRGTASGALLLTEALAALECRTVRRVPAGDHTLAAVMLESHLVGGAQDYRAQPLIYGRSITDACLAWEKTLPLFAMLAAAVTARRRHLA